MDDKKNKLFYSNYKLEAMNNWLDKRTSELEEKLTNSKFIVKVLYH